MIAPSMLSQAQFSPFNSSYAVSPAAQSLRNTPAFTHSWKRSWAVEEGQMPVADNAFHWQPVRRTKKMPSMHERSLARGRPPPKRWVFLCAGSSGAMRAQSSSGIRNPLAASSVRPRRSSSVTHFIQAVRRLSG